jgi:Flp pilus assembly protein TadD
MSKRLLNLGAACLLFFICLTAISDAQNATLREAEWQSFKLPAAEFTRITDPTKTLIFRVPSRWERKGDTLEFSGGENLELRVVLSQIPEGVGLKNYVASILQSLQNVPGGIDGLSVRRVQLSGIEAREIVFDYQDLKGALLRKDVWVAIDHSRVVMFVFSSPIATVAEITPYFKAVVQSATLFPHEFFYNEFDGARSKAIKTSKPSRVDEAQNLAAALESRDLAVRAKAISDLSQLFAASSDAALDLLVDRRPFIRAGAVRALAASKNPALNDLLLFAVQDLDWYVAAQAAQAVAVLPNVLTILRDESGKWRSNHQKFLDIASLLDVNTRAQLANSLFTEVKSSAKPSSKNPINVIAPPPPTPRVTPTPKTRGKVKKGAWVSAKPLGFVSVKAPGFLANDEQFLALNLLTDVPPELLKIPFADIVALNNGPMTNLALTVAIDRKEVLPVELLFKALDDDATSLLAAMALGHSATPADLAKIEAVIQKLSAKQPAEKAAVQKDAPSIRQPDQAKLLINQLEVASQRVQLRERLKTVSDKPARLALLHEAARDGRLALWVWHEHLREEIEGGRTAGQPTSARTKAPTIAPLGENLFPTGTQFYTALPKPGEALTKLGDSLTNLQMDSAREQAQFVYFLKAMREQMVETLGADERESFFEQIGINPDAPMAFASWLAEGAPNSQTGAERSAAIARVVDRDRFERALMVYQKNIGSFASFSNYASGIAHFVGLIPAIFPSLAADLLDPKEKKIPEVRPSNLFLAGTEECNGYAVKTVTRRMVDEKRGTIHYDSLYLVYVGDTALMAPDWYSLRDVLKRLEAGGPALSANTNFKRAVAAGGDVIYTSDVTGFLESFANTPDLTATAAPVETRAAQKANEISEFGALNISNSAWENTYKLLFKENEWTKPLIAFQAQQLAAPRDLLPDNTFAYLSLKFDAVTGWRDWSKNFFGETGSRDIVSVWAVDFEKEVLPEFADEFGAAILELPKNLSFDEVSWALFAKLKSDKLGRLLNDGKLFKDANGAVAHVKFGTTETMVAVKNGFLVIASNEASLNKLAGKGRLATTRDFSKAAKNTPANVVFFGGYNLDSAINALVNKTTDPEQVQLVSFFTTVARAFHSQNIYATLEPDGVKAQMSVSLAREGRYSVAELAEKTKDFHLAFAELEADGLPLVNQAQLAQLKLRIKASNKDALDHIKEILAMKSQVVEKQSDQALILTMSPRRAEPKEKIQLPVADAAFKEYLQPTREIRSDDANVIAKAKEIAASDRDAWSVARKLSDWTHQNLKWRRVDDADAAQTLATREADCLEFSELYIAMARALGLPSRLVTGLAHSGGTFGGHAWVEVYVGEWVELDPTWGTNYVDATHIRDASGELLSYAALNLMHLETLAATRAVPDFQRDATRFARAVTQDFAVNSDTGLAVAFDAEMLADAQMGAGAWAGMNEKEREQFLAAVSKLTDGKSAEYIAAGLSFNSLRLSKVKVQGDRAEVVAFETEGNSSFIFNMARKNDLWFVTEIVDRDLDFPIVANTLRPSVQMILAVRQGRPYQNAHLSDKTRALLALSQNPKITLEIAERVLKGEPQNAAFRLLKARALLRSSRQDELLQKLAQQKNQKEVEKNLSEFEANLTQAIKLLEDLSNAQPLQPLAILELADNYRRPETPEKEKAIKLYERYAALRPEDPRPHERLAQIFEEGQAERALLEYQAVIDRDSEDSNAYENLAEFLVLLKRYDEAMKVLDMGAKVAEPNKDLFADLFKRFYLVEGRQEAAEGLIAAQPERLAKSYDANLSLATMRIINKRGGEAVSLLKKAIEIDPNKAAAHIGLAIAYRQLKNWMAALAAADAAIKLDAKDAEPHYHRACAQARLGRKNEAMTSLKLAIELEEDYLYEIGDEADLKGLTLLPQFKKWLKEAEKDSESDK